ncbi:O-antigen polymerase [Sediminibacterium sp.]|uniref:O-antigen polymerase n=1 Tax=Sediminibacterium sp. TaxID=1917865 RepID=UPI00272F2B1B|nr:O-antigen polymerase [Sediminibacterium sp.]MDP2420247.1 O-antigen polymerase [Sediminibacterium sp.]
MGNNKNGVYIIIISLYCVSFFSQFLVARDVVYRDLFSIFNLFFSFINIFLIVYPWSYANVQFLHVKNNSFFIFLKRILYTVLLINLLLNIGILVVVFTFIPNIAEFKAEQAFLKLYDQIPYFANIFRYAYVSQNLGYFAIPIFFYELSNGNWKRAKIAIIFASSSLISGIAFYSRAQIFTFVMVFISYFFLVKNCLPSIIRISTLKYLKLFSIVIISFFILITFLRFSEMSYYGERIPSTSIIQNPILYSLVDYASQGFSNGFIQLERYDESKFLHGEQLFRDIYQILNFFGFISWDANDSQDKIDIAYDYDGGAFNGYTTPLVFNLGYFFAFVVSLIYFLLVRKFVKGKTIINLESSLKIIVFLFIPIVSIFYVGYPMLYFPLLFLLFVRILFFIFIFLKHIKF